MPVAKIHPPAQLPVQGLTEQQFQVWQTQLRAWLYCDEALGHFLPDSRYNQWQAEETNAHQIPALADPDPELLQDPTQAERQLTHQTEETTGGIPVSGDKLCRHQPLHNSDETCSLSPVDL